MAALHRFSVIVLVLLLQACGGGDGGSKSSVVASSASSVVAVASSSTIAPASSAASSSAITAVSSVASSSSVGVSSSAAASLPADFPIGTVEALPVLNITTVDSAPILSRETYINASFSLTGEGIAAVEGTTEIRGRGNSTWDWEKKPYRLKLANSTELLGMPASKHWVLLANYADKTLIRNDLAFMFSRSLGMEYTVRSQYVEVVLNGVYRGVYQLAEHIRVAKDRVNIPELKVTDTAVDKISGGYLIEVDFRMGRNYCVDNTWESFCVNNVNLERAATFCVDSTYGMDPFCLDTPETLLDASWSAQRDYISKYIGDTEAALFSATFTDAQLGYAAYIDVDSAINYFLINELFKNPDGATASFFLYKKRGGKLFFGPVWDFDLAMGNAGYGGLDLTSGWRTRNAPWFNRLFEDPAFAAKVKARWNSLKAEGKLEYIFQYAQARATWLDKQQQKNYQLWSVTNIADWIRHGTHGGTGSYEAEVKELIRWQRERYQWMDTQLNN
ncbi:MAG TPA: CotH kinase family protein [Cellvibrio sp.]|nr:CotH kinase family protein [Cellvibrio sp.]